MNGLTTRENLFWAAVLYKVQLWVTIAEFGAGIIRRLCVDPIKLYLQWGFKKPNLLDSWGSVNNKTLQSTITTANTKVTRVAVAGAYNEAINVLHDKGSGHTRL